MGLTKAKLESFRKDLAKRRDLLARDLRQATAELIGDDVAYTDTVDQASALTDKTFALQLKSRGEENLWRIDAALKRIEAGTFGDCERCGESITEARIRAFPFTTLCIDCKAELESEEHRFPGRM